MEDYTVIEDRILAVDIETLDLVLGTRTLAVGSNHGSIVLRTAVAASVFAQMLDSYGITIIEQETPVFVLDSIPMVTTVDMAEPPEPKKRSYQQQQRDLPSFFRDRRRHR